MENFKTSEDPLNILSAFELILMQTVVVELTADSLRGGGTLCQLH